MTEVADADRAIGVEAFASSGPPCAARAKSSEEDFRVEELVSGPGAIKEPREGYYPLYRVEKRAIDTMHMERELSDILKSRVSYGGLKDKRAVAVQYVTPTSLRSERPEAIIREKFTATLLGFVPRPLSKGSVTGNRFEVVLRDCCEEVGGLVEDVFGMAEEMKVPSFYGLQRFGSRRAGTHTLGRALVKGKFEEAVRLMLTEARSGDDEDTRLAKEAMANGRYGEGWKLLPAHQDVEKRVARRLSQKPGDWVGALRAVPIRLRRLYTQAYQSFIFNRTLSLALKRGLDISKSEDGDNWSESRDGGFTLSPVHGVREPRTDSAFPMVQIPGFAYRNYGSRFDSCVEEVMSQEEVSAREFYVREMQEASAEGGFRVAHMAFRDGRFEVDGTTATLRFTLARGQYATVLLREIIKPTDPKASGLA
ncbi:MAG: tRNA pseudouridine(13) synthase TruD [Candidatus Gagatemarchaeaceae archaeon]